MTMSIVPAKSRSANAKAAGLSSSGISRIDGAMVTKPPRRSSSVRISGPLRLSKEQTLSPERPPVPAFSGVVISMLQSIRRPASGDLPQKRHATRRHPFHHEDVAVLVVAGVVGMNELTGFP